MRSAQAHSAGGLVVKKPGGRPWALADAGPISNYKHSIDVGSRLMNVASLSRDLYGFAIELRQLAYTMPGGYQDPLVRLSERMIPSRPGRGC
jgi:hypothetical protein